MGKINEYPKANAINGNDTLLGVVGGTTKQVAKDVLLSGVTNDIDNTTIVGEKTGKVVTANDSSYHKLPALTVYGRSEQKSYTGKNLLQNKATSQTVNGITFTVNNDGLVTASGTATAQADFSLGNQYLETEESYIFSNGLSGDTSNYFSYVARVGDTVQNLGASHEFIFTTEADTVRVVPFICIKSGVTVSNLTFYPMIRKASITDATYEPYVGGEASPNPSYPQAITSVADDKSLVVKSCGKNLLENKATTQTNNGITFTVNEDKSVTVNGTATSKSVLNINTNIKIPNGTYIMSGCVSGVNDVFHTLQKNLIDGTKKWLGEKGQGATFTVDDTVNILIMYIEIGVGVTLNNATFYPMIRPASIEDDTYEPYVSTQASLTVADDLRGIPVSEGGNYTDENGQSWICDTLEKYADGSGKYIQRVYHKVFNGTESYLRIYTNASGGNQIGYGNSNIKIPSADCPNVRCNKLSVYARLWNDNVNGCMLTNHVDYPFRFRVVGITTVADMQAQLKAWYDADDPMEFICELAEYVETDLTAEQMAELEKLQSFNPYTTVYTDDIGEIAITYFKNSDSGKIVGGLNDRISNLVALLQSNGVI